MKDQRSEVRDQRSEVRDQKTEVRDQKTEVRSQRAEGRKRKTNGRHTKRRDSRYVRKRELISRAASVQRAKSKQLFASLMREFGW
jgi:hypothetical protein